MIETTWQQDVLNWHRDCLALTERLEKISDAIDLGYNSALQRECNECIHSWALALQSAHRLNDWLVCWWKTLDFGRHSHFVNHGFTAPLPGNRLYIFRSFDEFLHLLELEREQTQRKTP